MSMLTDKLRLLLFDVLLVLAIPTSFLTSCAQLGEIADDLFDHSFFTDSKGNNSEDINNSESYLKGKEISKWFDSIPSAIYELNYGASIVIIAKTTDNYLICLENPGRFSHSKINFEYLFAIPQHFVVYSPDKTYYTLEEKEYEIENGNFYITPTVQYFTKDVVVAHSRYEMMFEQFSGLYNIELSSNAKMKIVAPGGDFNALYAKMAQLYCLKPLIPLDEMFTQSYIDNTGIWNRSLYPEDLNSKKFVFPYTGNGKISQFKVKYDYERPERIEFPYPCSTKKVVSIDVKITDVDTLMVERYMQQVRTQGLWTIEIPDKTNKYPTDKERKFLYLKNSFEDVSSKLPSGVDTCYAPLYKVVYSREPEETSAENASDFTNNLMIHFEVEELSSNSDL